MKHVLLALFLVTSVWAEELPPASQILAAARAQLPSYPIVMTGTLKQWAANNHMKKALSVEVTLDWSAEPPCAEYQINDKKKFQTLEIKWVTGGPIFQCLENDVLVSKFNPHEEIENLGITWSDLSFSFLWDKNATTLGVEKAFGKERYEISIPRPNKRSLLLWIEKENGRLVRVEEYDADRKKVKTIKIVSVKKFDGLWMAKDLDIIRHDRNQRTSLRIDTLEAQ